MPALQRGGRDDEPGAHHVAGPGTARPSLTDRPGCPGFTGRPSKPGRTGLANTRSSAHTGGTRRPVDACRTGRARGTVDPDTGPVGSGSSVDARRAGSPGHTRHPGGTRFAGVLTPLPPVPAGPVAPGRPDRPGRPGRSGRPSLPSRRRGRKPSRQRPTARTTRTDRSPPSHPYCPVYRKPPKRRLGLSRRLHLAL